MDILGFAWVLYVLLTVVCILVPWVRNRCRSYAAMAKPRRHFRRIGRMWTVSRL